MYCFLPHLLVCRLASDHGGVAQVAAIVLLAVARRRRHGTLPAGPRRRQGGRSGRRGQGRCRRQLQAHVRRRRCRGGGGRRGGGGLGLLLQVDHPRGGQELPVEVRRRGRRGRRRGGGGRRRRKSRSRRRRGQLRRGARDRRQVRRRRAGVLDERVDLQGLRVGERERAVLALKRGGAVAGSRAGGGNALLWEIG